MNIVWLQQMLGRLGISPETPIKLIPSNVSPGYGGLVSWGANVTITNGEHNLLLSGDPLAGPGKVTTASSNVALIATGGLGYLSAANVTGSNNVAIGENVLPVLTTGYNNIVIGYSVGTLLTLGYKNIIIGSSTDPETTFGTVGGNSNVFIGADCVPSAANRTSAIGIGNGVTVNANSTWVIGGLGKKQAITEGTNGCMGAATLVGGTVVVSNTLVTTTSRIFLTNQNGAGTVGSSYVSARTAGTSFTITSTSGTDTSLIAWEIKEPN